MNHEGYLRARDAGTLKINEAIHARVRDLIIRLLWLKDDRNPPSYLFVGRLEYEALKSDMGITVERIRGTDDMQLTFDFKVTTIQKVDRVTLLVRLVPEEDSLVKVA